MKKILFLLLLILVNYNQKCLADEYLFYNFGQNISFEQTYEEECEEHIEYVKNLKFYQAMEKIGKEIDQKINYQKTFQKELNVVESDKNKIMLRCDFSSGIKFENFANPYSYVKTEIKVFDFKFCLEGRASDREQEVVFLFEKRF